MSGALDRLETTAWLGTTALAAAVGVRLFTVLSSEALGSAADHFEASPSTLTPAASPSIMPSPMNRQRQEQVLELASDDAGVRLSSTGSSPAALIYPTLYVNFGPERSEVFVNGVRVGQTPFIGEVGCRMGDLVKVDIAPPAGAPLRFMGRCNGAVLVVKKDE